VLLPRFLPEDLWIPFDWLDLPAERMGTAADRGTAGTMRGDWQSRTWQWGIGSEASPPSPVSVIPRWHYGPQEDCAMTEPVLAPIHISVVLDRSGSMNSVADDTVGGFNEFLAEQRRGTGAARVTLAQFDSEDPFELLIDGADLREVADLARSAYQPRAWTPLYDAIGQMISRIDEGIAERAQKDLPEEDQVVAIVTDGLENRSTRFTRQDVFGLIDERRRAGWVFVFLGADQDTYAAGGQIGVAPRERVVWEKTPEGIKKMWGDLSHSTDLHRAKPQEQRRREADEFHTPKPEEK
jgi:hypothetical protein